MRPARDRRPASAAALLAALLAAAAALAACGGPSASGTAGSVQTAATPAAASAAPSPGSSQLTLVSPVTGVLVHIDSAGLSAVSGFRLRLDDGREVAFRIGTLENGDQFPPGHLAEHLASADPVRVYFRSAGSDLVVYRIEDAGAPSPAASPTAP